MTEFTERSSTLRASTALDSVKETIKGEGGVDS